MDIHQLRLSPGIDPVPGQLVRHLGAGGLALLPTDTIYGILAAYRPKCLAEIYRLKGRPETKPVLMLVGQPLAKNHFRELQEKYIQPLNEWQSRVLDLNWPGPFTFVFDKRPEVPGPGGSLGVRFPSPEHWIRNLLDQLEFGLAAPSANQSDIPYQPDLGNFLERVERLASPGVAVSGAPASNQVYYVVLEAESDDYLTSEGNKAAAGDTGGVHIHTPPSTVVDIRVNSEWPAGARLSDRILRPGGAPVRWPD